jgi:hypothetical protein
LLARVTPGRSSFHIRTFECAACDYIHQRVVEIVDPMKSIDTLGWFRGELRFANVRLLSRRPVIAASADAVR